MDLAYGPFEVVVGEVGIVRSWGIGKGRHVGGMGRMYGRGIGGYVSRMCANVVSLIVNGERRAVCTEV